MHTTPIRPSVTLKTDCPLRDPFILSHNGAHYLYATGWTVSRLLPGGELSAPVPCVEYPADFDSCDWAPEVYHYGGRFYMFTTYRSTETGHRGCAVFVADTPEGPFRLHSDGHFTPHDRDAIDATLYIDEAGDPWAVYVEEWTTTPDNIGRMDTARLSADLTHLITEPIELFRADDPAWSRAQVTDGCFLHRTAAGSLLMLWSNWDDEGYCVAIARSTSGRLTGPWIQEETRLFSKSITGEYDGGHGMILRTDDGLWLSIHSPNSERDGRIETPVLVPIREENDTLVWDTDPRRAFPGM
mgnify:CR=1 FL=1